MPLRREHAIDTEIRRRHRIQAHQAEVADLEACGRELLGVEALDFVERGARAEIEPMESVRIALRCDLASPHHPGAGIDRHPFRSRQVDAELHVREAAVLMYRG